MLRWSESLNLTLFFTRPALTKVGLRPSLRHLRGAILSRRPFPPLRYFPPFPFQCPQEEPEQNYSPRRDRAHYSGFPSPSLSHPWIIHKIPSRMEEDGLTDYERLRQENIRRNQVMLASVRRKADELSAAIQSAKPKRGRPRNQPCKKPNTPSPSPTSSVVLRSRDPSPAAPNCHPRLPPPSSGPPRLSHRRPILVRTISMLGRSLC